MKKWKKVTSMLLVMAMTLSMAGCNGKQEEVTEAEETTEITTELAAEEDTEEEVQGNLIQNGDFSEGTDKFETYTNGGSCSMNVNSDGELQLDITKLGNVEHGVQLYYDGFEMTEGTVYEFSFDIHGTMERELEWRIQINGGDYHAYHAETVSVTEEVQHISAQFTMEEPSDPAPRLCFNMGYMNSMQEAGMDSANIGEHSIMLDNLSLEVMDSSEAVEAAETVEVPKAKVNQLGYKKDDVKTVVFCGFR